MKNTNAPDTLVPFPEDDALNWPQPIIRTMLPDGSMRYFQDEAAWFFQRYANPAVGYIITNPERLEPIALHTNAKAAVCVAVRHEEDFEKLANHWQFMSVCNMPSLDLTECLTMVTFTCPAREPAESGDFLDVHIPDQLIMRAIDDAADTEGLVVVLCSPTRALLLVFPFDEADMNELHAASVLSINWRPYRIYDEETMNEAAEKFGHLNKKNSEGWGMEIPPFFTEEEAKALRKKHLETAQSSSC